MKLDEVLLELRRLHESVPRPLRLPTAEEIETVERALGVQFHPDYRKFLLEASDVVFGTTEPATITDPSSYTHLAAICREAWGKMGLPRGLLPICETNADYYCMNPEGEIVFWSHSGLTDEKWPDLTTWIKQIWIEQG